MLPYFDCELCLSPSKIVNQTTTVKNQLQKATDELVPPAQTRFYISLHSTAPQLPHYCLTLLPRQRLPCKHNSTWAASNQSFSRPKNASSTGVTHVSALCFIYLPFRYIVCASVRFIYTKTRHRHCSGANRATRAAVCCVS